MTALDFPSNPTVGQVFDRWSWDGTKWTLAGASSRGRSFVQVNYGELTYWISGGAGASAGNPRIHVYSPANVQRSGPTDWESQPGGGGFTCARKGRYRIRATMRQKANWTLFVGAVAMRGTTQVAGSMPGLSRGTWGNPPGVTGMDANFLSYLDGEFEYDAEVGDVVRVQAYSAGGADATSTIGDNDGKSVLSIESVDHRGA